MCFERERERERERVAVRLFGALSLRVFSRKEVRWEQEGGLSFTIGYQYVTLCKLEIGVGVGHGGIGKQNSASQQALSSYPAEPGGRGAWGVVTMMTGVVSMQFLSPPHPHP